MIVPHLFSAILFAGVSLKLTGNLEDIWGEVHCLYIHEAMGISWLYLSRTSNHNCLSGCFALQPFCVGMVLLCVVLILFPRTAVVGGQEYSFPCCLHSPLDAVFLRHLLPLSTSFVSCESFLSVWGSRQWKGNCLDQLSSVCIFQGHHLSFKSIHSSSRTENNLWSHSFAFSSLKQKHFMPVNTSHCLGPLQRKMCPGCFSSPMFTCPLPALLAANGSCFWWLWLAWAWWWHSPALPAYRGVCVPLALHSHCRGAVLQPQQGFGDCHLQRMGVRHVHAVTLFSCTSLHDWALQYLQHLGVAVAVCSRPHIPKFSSLLCVGDHKSPLALSMQVFQTQRRRSRPALLFLAALSTSLLPKHCGRGGGRRCDTTLQPPGSCYWSALVMRWLYGTAQTIKINNKRGIQICSAHLAFHLLIAILASLGSKYFLFLFLILHIYQFQSEQLVTTNFIPS